MAIHIDEMTVDVEEARPDHAPPALTSAPAVEALVRQALAALAEEEARRQRLVAD